MMSCLRLRAPYTPVEITPSDIENARNGDIESIRRLIVASALDITGEVFRCDDDKGFLRLLHENPVIREDREFVRLYLPMNKIAFIRKLLKQLYGVNITYGDLRYKVLTHGYKYGFGDYFMVKARK